MFRFQEWVLNRCFPNRETGVFANEFWRTHAPAPSFGLFVIRAGLIAGVATTQIGRNCTIQSPEPMNDVLRMIAMVYQAEQSYILGVMMAAARGYRDAGGWMTEG